MTKLHELAVFPVPLCKDIQFSTKYIVSNMKTIQNRAVQYKNRLFGINHTLKKNNRKKFIKSNVDKMQELLNYKQFRSA